MSVFGNIGKFLGNVFGGDDEDKKKKQQQANLEAARQQSTRPAMSQQQKMPDVSQQPDNGINLVLPQRTPANGPINLALGMKPPGVDQNIDNGPVQAPKKVEPSLLSKVGKVVKAVGSGAAGTSLAATRVVTGAAQGIADTGPLLEKAAVWGARKLSGNKTAGQSIDDAANTALSVIDKPFNAVNEKLDAAANAYGDTSSKIYRPAQVVGNVATIVPGAAELAANGLSKANKAPQAAAVLEKIGAQGKTPFINNILQKFHLPGRSTPGLTSNNPNQEADAIKQIGDQMAQQNAEMDARMQMAGDDPITKRMRTLDGGGAQGIPDKMPKGGENFVSPRDVAASDLRKADAEALAK
jgi:hypothetical protein